MESISEQLVWIWIAIGIVVFGLMALMGLLAHSIRRLLAMDWSSEADWDTREDE